MPNINEFIDSLSDDMITPEAKESLRKEVNALEKHNSQLYQRAKRAEGFELDKDTKKWVKREIKTKEEEKPNVKADTPGKFDYAQKAYLNSLGYKEDFEQAKIMEIMMATGKELDEVVKLKYVQAELKELKDDMAAKKAMPSGSHRSGSASGKDSVEYWISKGELPPADKPELRRQYVNARIERERGGNPFAK